MATKPFAGKDNKAEEMAEARKVRSGKVTPAQYVRAEKKEGDKSSRAALLAKGKALASGKMSASQYGQMADKKAKR